MKILIVSYTYLPDKNPRSLRWSQLLNHWSEKGHDIHVVTASQASSEEPGNLKILRVNENLIGRIRKKLLEKRVNSGRIESYTSRNLISINFITSIVRKLVSRLYKNLLKNLQWPDYAWTWISNATKESISLVNNNGPFDVLISVSHPFSSHLVAKHIKIKNPNLNWLIDMGDPFCFLHEAQPNNFDRYNKKNQDTEEEVFNLCKYASVTTEETKIEYSNIFPESAHKIKVIPPLIDEEVLRELKNHNEKENNSNLFLKLVFVGTLYSKIRNPNYLLKFLEKINHLLDKDIEMHFFGLTNDVKVEELDNMDYPIYFHGEVSKEESFRQVLSADILVNIGNSTHYQLPSKLVEYALSGKPILNVSSVNNDSSANFLKKHPNSKTICSSEPLTESLLSEIVKFFNESSSHDFDGEDFIKNHRISMISKKYENLLS